MPRYISWRSLYHINDVLYDIIPLPMFWPSTTFSPVSAPKTTHRSPARSTFQAADRKVRENVICSEKAGLVQNGLRISGKFLCF